MPRSGQNSAEAEYGPIAQAPAKSKGVTKSSSIRISADRYHGLATPTISEDGRPPLPPKDPPRNARVAEDNPIVDEDAFSERDIKNRELLDQVERFAEDYKLQIMLPVLQTGALIAQEPWIAPNIQELKESNQRVYGSVHTPTPDELAALRDEEHNVWHHRKEIPKTIILGSIAAAVQ